MSTGQRLVKKTAVKTEKVEKVETKHISNFLTQMKKLQMSDPFYQGKLAAKKEWESLAKGDPKRDQLIVKWLKDKKCNSWTNTHTEMVEDKEGTKNTTLAGHGTSSVC